MKTIKLTREEFEDLLEYSLSNPTAQIIGKKWKRKMGPSWYLCEYVESSKPGYVDIIFKLIQSGPPVPPNQRLHLTWLTRAKAKVTRVLKRNSAGSLPRTR